MKHRKNKRLPRVNQAVICFTNKAVTAWGGIASLAAKLLEVIEFRKWAETEIPITETSPNSKGICAKALGRFLTVLTGGTRFSHSLWRSNGMEVLLKTFGAEWPPKAPSALSRFWDKIQTQAQSEPSAEKRRDLARKIIRFDNIKEDALNLDSSILTRYGNQEGALKGYNPKKPGRNSRHPLIAFLGSGYVMNLWNRSGKAGSGESAKEFFIRNMKSIGDSISIKKVLCDTGFYLIDFIDYLELEKLRYIISTPMISTLQREIMNLRNWKYIDRGIEGASFRFTHKDEKRKKERRYVVIRQLKD